MVYILDQKYQLYSKQFSVKVNNQKYKFHQDLWFGILWFYIQNQ